MYNLDCFRKNNKSIIDVREGGEVEDRGSDR